MEYRAYCALNTTDPGKSCNWPLCDLIQGGLSRRKVIIQEDRCNLCDATGTTSRSKWENHCIVGKWRMYRR